MPTYEGQSQRLCFGLLSEITLEATAGDIYTWIPDRNWLVTGASVLYSVATDAAQVTKAVVAVDHDPAGSVARTEEGRYTSEVSKAIGTEESMSVITTGVAPQFLVAAGDKVIFELVTELTAGEVGKVRLILYAKPVADGVI